MDNPLRAALKAFDAAARGAFEIIAAFWRLMQQAVFHHGTGHEVALATAATAPSSFVARGLQKGSKDASCLNGEHLNLSARIRIETEQGQKSANFSSALLPSCCLRSINQPINRKNQPMLR